MIASVILAAGHGSRMQSKIPKVLHSLGGKRLIDYVYELVSKITDQVIIVASEELLPYINQKADIAIQKEPLGTGHAVLTALQYLKPEIKEFIVVFGDTPLLEESTLKKIIDAKEEIVLGGFSIASKIRDYGRICLNSEGVPIAIVEYRELKQEEFPFVTANAGVMKLSKDIAQNLLPTLSNANKSGEYYLTEIVEKAHCTRSVVYGDQEEFLGINSRADFARAQLILQHRWMQKLMDSGITIENPHTITVSFDTEIQMDSMLSSNVHCGPGVKIGKGVKILPFVYLEHCTIGDHAIIGPFCHIRGNSFIEDNAQVGNFVEINRSILGKNSKAKHLSYLGDATVGDHTNIGAGAITCNFDGQKKHKTYIGNEVSIGSNVSLIAPIKIGNQAYVGAGSTITKDVEHNSLVIERSQEIHKKNWVKKKELP